MSSSPSIHSFKLMLSPAAWCVLAAGLAVRIYLFREIPVINPDGFLYIQQAKALHYGLLDELLSCYSKLTPYSVAIRIAYPLFGDWVVAAQSVNLFFGTVSIIPLYWILRSFFEDAVASLTILIFALLPAFALVSADALRDPMFWFFALLGFFLLIRHMGKRASWLLMGCSICFALAAWARVEGVLYVLMTALFLLFSQTRKKWTDLFIFLTPYLFLAGLLLVLSNRFGLDGFADLNLKRIVDIPLSAISRYEAIRGELKALYQLGTSDISVYFFDRIRSLVWIIALVALIVFIVENLVYLYSILLVVGAVSLARRVWTDRRIRYTALMSLSALVLLYFHTLFMWHAAGRHLAVFLLPAFVFIAAGIERCHSFLSLRLRYKPVAGYAILCGIIVLTLAPKILRAHFNTDKLIFSDIGHYISEREAGQQAVSVCGAFKEVRDVHFYANVNTVQVPCFDNSAFFRRANAQLFTSICNGEYDYFIWDQTGWRNKEIISDPDHSGCRFNKVSEWRSQKLGRLILYEVVK